MKSRQIGTLVIILLMAFLLLGCESIKPTLAESSITVYVVSEASADPASAFAQATIDAGQNQLQDLARRETEVNLEMAQAANVAAQSTQDAIQRQQIELDFQATVISQNIAEAAATQQAIAQQTEIAVNATSAAQSIAATDAQAAYLVYAAQTAQVQANIEALVMQTNQAAAALTAFPLTATPLAGTEAALLLVQYDREQQAFEDQVVIPLIPVVGVVFSLLLILGIVVLYRRFIPRAWPRRYPTLGSSNDFPPLMMIEGVMVDHDAQEPIHRPSGILTATPPGLPGPKPIRVEIVEASEPPFSHWIDDVEYQLAAEGRQPQ